MIQRAFVSRNIDLLVRAYLVYVRPLVEYNSVVCSPYTIQDIETVEKVQRRFTKKIFLDYVNSPITRGYNIYPVLNYGVYMLIWCGVTKYFLASLRHQLRIFSCAVRMLQLDVTNTNYSRSPLFRAHGQTFFCERIVNA